MPTTWITKRKASILTEMAYGYGKGEATRAELLELIKGFFAKSKGEPKH